MGIGFHDTTASARLKQFEKKNLDGIGTIHDMETDCRGHPTTPISV